MEGQLLSDGPAAGEDAAVLRGALSDRRDQLHVLSDADGEARRRVGGADAVALQADAQGAAAHHARQPAEELRSAAWPPSAAWPARSATSSARCCFSCRRTRRRICRCSTRFWTTFRRARAAAFEFRHASWLDDEVFERLRRRNLALCIADSEKMSTPVQITADYAYFRLRDEGYTADDIARWADTIARETRRCRDVFVYFKHEEEGKGPGVRQAADASIWESRPVAPRNIVLDAAIVHHRQDGFRTRHTVSSRDGEPSRARDRRDRNRQDSHAAAVDRSLLVDRCACVSGRRQRRSVRPGRCRFADTEARRASEGDSRRSAGLARESSRVLGRARTSRVSRPRDGLRSRPPHARPPARAERDAGRGARDRVPGCGRLRDCCCSI